MNNLLRSQRKHMAGIASNPLMNKVLNARSLPHQSGHPSTQGFVLPLAMGFGLVVVLIGTTMILRSQTDRTAASSQTMTVLGLTAAETGIGRIQALMNRNRAIAIYPACPEATAASCKTPNPDNPPNITWKNPKDIEGLGKCTGSADEVKQAATRTWKDIPGGGQYRLFDYTYDDVTSRGLLIVEGRANPNAAANVPVTRLQVGVSVFDVSPQQPVPALWLTDNSPLNKDRFTGDIVYSTCSLPGKVTEKDNLTDPAAYDIITTAPGTRPKLPKLPELTKRNDILNAPDIWDTVLPRLGDNSTEIDGRRIFTYVVSELKGAASQTINIKVEKDTDIVDIVVQGDIELKDSAALNPNGVAPQLRILSNDAKKVKLNSVDGRVNALIFTPNAEVEIETGGTDPNDPGGVDGAPDAEKGRLLINGSIWAKSWKSSDNDNVKLSAVGSYVDYGIKAFAQREGFSTVKTWEQVQLN